MEVPLLISLEIDPLPESRMWAKWKSGGAAAGRWEGHVKWMGPSVALSAGDWANSSSSSSSGPLCTPLPCSSVNLVDINSLVVLLFLDAMHSALDGIDLFKKGAEVKPMSLQQLSICVPENWLTGFESDTLVQFLKTAAFHAGSFNTASFIWHFCLIICVLQHGFLKYTVLLYFT